MKIRMTKIRMTLTLTLLVVATLLVTPNVSQATILTFDIRADNGSPPGGASVTGGSLETGTYSTYGNNVNATSVDVGSHYFNYDMGNGFTPDIGVSYAKGSAGQDFRFSIQGGWGNQAIAYPLATNGQQGSAGDRWFVNFSPQVTATGVTLNEFTLMDYNGTRTNAVDWFVYKDSVGPTNIIASGSSATFSSSFTSPFVVDTGGISYVGDLILEMRFHRGDRGQLGIDNINFDQFTVPEPSTLSLAGLAALGLCQYRRRRQRRQRRCQRQQKTALAR